MVTEVSFPPGMALLVARHTMLCPFSTSPGEMKRVLTMLSRLPSRSRVWGRGRERRPRVTRLGRPGQLQEEGALCTGGGQLRTPGYLCLHRAGVTFCSPVWLSAGLQKKKKERFPLCVKISLDLLTPHDTGNGAAGPVDCSELHPSAFPVVGPLGLHVALRRVQLAVMESGVGFGAWG